MKFLMKEKNNNIIKFKLQRNKPKLKKRNLMSKFKLIYIEYNKMIKH